LDKKRFNPNGLNVRRKKEETKMRYEKPEVMTAKDALESIQGGSKPMFTAGDGSLHVGTINAYEADE
jgi:hypothetical protein